MSRTSETIIIGGGINGVSTAFHLAKQGIKATVLEKNFIASGPTGYSCAIIRQHYSNEVTARMALKALNIWKNFDEAIGGEAGFTHTGFFVAVGPENVDALKANIALQQSVGIETRFVDPKEIKELEPHLDTAGVGGAAFEPEGGYCDPASAANSFVKAAQRLGAEFRTGITVTQIAVKSGKVIGVDTSEGFFPADAVVATTGPWTPKLLTKLGVELPVTPIRVKIGVFRRPEEIERHAIWGDFLTQTYFRPESGNLMLVGSISPDESKDVVSDPENINTKVEMETIAKYAEAAATRYPAMRESELSNNYASMYDITPDWHPVLDQIPDHQGSYVCAGSSGHGFKLSPVVGEMMANLVVHSKQPEDDINLFSFERFASGDLVRGEYEYNILG